MRNLMKKKISELLDHWDHLLGIISIISINFQIKYPFILILSSSTEDYKIKEKLPKKSPTRVSSRISRNTKPNYGEESD